MRLLPRSRLFARKSRAVRRSNNATLNPKSLPDIYGRIARCPRNPDEAWRTPNAPRLVFSSTPLKRRVNITKAMTVLEQRQERQINSRSAALTLSFTAKSSAQTPIRRLIAKLEDQFAEPRLDFEAFQFNLYAAHPELKTRRAKPPPPRLAQAGRLAA